MASLKYKIIPLALLFLYFFYKPVLASEKKGLFDLLIEERLTPVRQENPGFEKGIDFFKGVSVCCILEAMQRCDLADEEAAYNHLMGCYFSNTGVSAVPDLIDQMSDFSKWGVSKKDPSLNALSDTLRKMTGVDIKHLAEMPELVEVKKAIHGFAPQQPNPAYMQGEASYERCAKDLMALKQNPASCVEESIAESGVCNIQIRDARSPQCEEGEEGPLIFRGLAGGNSRSVLYTIRSDKGYFATGPCDRICKVEVPAEKLHPGEVFSVEMMAFTEKESCTDQMQFHVPGAAPVMTESFFNIDPLLYEIRGMSRALNPYTEGVVSTYDDLLLYFKVEGVHRASAAEIVAEYEVAGKSSVGINSDFLDKGRLSLEGLKDRNYKTGFDDMGEDLAADWTEEIQRIAPEGLKRDQPQLRYQNCVVEGVVPVSNAWTHRGWIFESHLTVKQIKNGEENLIKKEDGVQKVSKYNVVFLKHETQGSADDGAFVAEGKKQFDHFFQIAKKTGGFLQRPEDAKLIFRPEQICAGSLGNLAPCALGMKEHWGTHDTLAGFYEGRSHARMGEGLIFFDPASPWVFAHEIGHTYGLCDEYDYMRFSEENQYWGCRNAYPLCAVDHPEVQDRSVANNCYNVMHAELFRTESGESVYTDSLPRPSDENRCIGAIVGCDGTMSQCGGADVRRSVMGASTSKELAERGMKEGSVAPVYPANVRIPEHR